MILLRNIKLKRSIPIQIQEERSSSLALTGGENMEKISGILPATNRITTVDRSGEHPLRSGHEATFGRQISASEVVSRGKPKLTLREAPKAYDRLSERKLKDRMHAEIVNRMSSEFFGKAQKDLSPVYAEPVVKPSETNISALPEMTSERVESTISGRNYEINEEAYGAFANEVDSQMEEAEPFYAVGGNFSRVV